MTALLSGMTDDPQALALTLYGPMFLLYSVYDGAQDKEAVTAMLDAQGSRAVMRLRDGHARTLQRYERENIRFWNIRACRLASRHGHREEQARRRHHPQLA